MTWRLSPLARTAWNRTRSLEPYRRHKEERWRRASLVEAPARRIDRRRLEPLALARNRSDRKIAQRHDEQVEARLRFGFRRLDQHRPVHDEREIDGHRVIALVDHRLGEIERRQPGVLQPAVVEQ